MFANDIDEEFADNIDKEFALFRIRRIKRSQMACVSRDDIKFDKVLARSLAWC